MTTRDHLRTLWRRRWLLAGVVALCLAVAVGYVALTTPVWEARAELVVVSEDGSRSAVLAAAAPVLSMIGEPASALGGSDLATQVQLVESRPSLEGAWGLMHQRPELLETLQREGLTDELADSLPAALRELGPQPPPTAWPETYQAMLETLMVMPVEDSQLIEVRCESTDPRLACDFVNALVLAYLGRSLGDARSVTRRMMSYVREELEDVEQRLAEAEGSLQSFGERSGTVALDEAARQQIGLMVRLQEQAAIAESTMRAQAAAQEQLQRRLEEMDPRIERSVVLTRNPQIADLQRALAEAEAERSGLLEEYAPESMPVRRATATVEELRDRLADAAEEVVGSREEAVNPVAQEIAQELIIAQGEELAARRSREVLEAAAERVEASLAHLPARQVELIRLQREIELLERVYMALNEREQEYEITSRTRQPASRLVSHAIVADEPVRPKVGLSIAAALGAGVLLGLLAVGAAEQIDQRIHDPAQAARLLGLPVLCALGGGWREDAQPDEADLEALRVLRSQLRSAAEGRRAVLFDCSGDAAELAEALESIDEGDDGAACNIVAASPGARGVLETLDTRGDAAVAVVVVALHRTTVDDATAMIALARDRGARLVGIVATGARRSSARYHPVPMETRG